jgi:hypoxanthine phosphoribosyltransferase
MDSFRTLIDAVTIERRIREIARDLAARYPDAPPVSIAVIEGARVFTRHLMAYLPWKNTVVHEVRASSYGDGMESRGSVAVSGGDSIPVDGQRVVLLEDIVDTGRTVARLREYFLGRGAVDVTVVTLLSKPSRRVVDVELAFVGFDIPNEFVIGFGMDVAGKFRELDRVAIYEEAREVGNA